MPAFSLPSLLVNTAPALEQEETKNIVLQEMQCILGYLNLMQLQQDGGI